MLTHILLTTIVLPLILGILIAVAGKENSTRSIALTALLIPIAAAIASVSIEGFPTLPPIAAKQKLPVLLLSGGIVFMLLALGLKQPLERGVSILISVISLAVPVWWLGRNIIIANSTKATTLGVVLMLAAIAQSLVSSGRSQRLPSAALPASLMATAIATALSAILGGYIGMAQMSGALAALFGGWLLVGYIAYLRGKDNAFALQGMAAFAFVWTAAIAVAMTVLFTPSAVPATLVLSVLPIAVSTVLSWRQITFAHQPRFLRPLTSGVLVAVPAAVAVLIAAIVQA
ncbi:hypothetical protein SAMN05518861_13044 [Mesorhizobium sp. YR577]|nr:hypothetical protein SAMN05518861_13044 [Mesorhizobium sp. YR577]